MSDSEDAAIKAEIDAISETIDTILRKIDTAIPVSPGEMEDQKPPSESPRRQNGADQE